MSNPIELTQQQRAYLYSLTTTQGWEVMLKLMSNLCTQANEAVIKCDPLEDKKILTLQNTARAMNKFCADLIKQISWNVQEGTAQAIAEHEPELAGRD
jgi:hypothetical protein